MRHNSFQPNLPQPYCNPLGYALLIRCPHPRLRCSPGEHPPLRLRLDFLSRTLNQRRGPWRSRWRPSRPTGRDQAAQSARAQEPDVGFLARRNFDDDDADRALATSIAAKETAYTCTCLTTACWAGFKAGSVKGGHEPDNAHLAVSRLLFTYAPVSGSPPTVASCPGCR